VAQPGGLTLGFVLHLVCPVPTLWCWADPELRAKGGGHVEVWGLCTQRVCKGTPQRVCGRSPPEAAVLTHSV